MELEHLILVQIRQDELRERILQLADKCRNDAARHGVIIKDIKPSYLRPVIL